MLIPVIDKNKKIISIKKLDEKKQSKKFFHLFLIMAGGLGMRLRPLTNKIPKPMIKINGVPMLERIIKNFKENGFKTLYFNIL